MPIVIAERDWDPESCRRTRAARAAAFLEELRGLGLQRFGSISFIRTPVCSDVPVATYNGMHFTYAYPAEHRGVALVLECAARCGEQIYLQIHDRGDLELFGGATWGHCGGPLIAAAGGA